jgi:hypothetical protein
MRLAVLNIVGGKNGLYRLLNRLLGVESDNRIRDVQVLCNVPHKRCIIRGTSQQDPREVPAITRR